MWDAEGRYYPNNAKEPLLSASYPSVQYDPNFRGIKTENRKFHDIPCAILFWIMFAAMVGVCVVGFTKGYVQIEYNSDIRLRVPKNLVPSTHWTDDAETRAAHWLQDAVAHMKHDVDILAGSLGLAFVLAFVWTYLLRTFTKLFI